MAIPGVSTVVAAKAKGCGSPRTPTATGRRRSSSPSGSRSPSRGNGSSDLKGSPPGDSSGSPSTYALPKSPLGTGSRPQRSPEMPPPQKSPTTPPQRSPKTPPPRYHVPSGKSAASPSRSPGESWETSKVSLPPRHEKKYHSGKSTSSSSDDWDSPANKRILDLLKDDTQLLPKMKSPAVSKDTTDGQRTEPLSVSGGGHKGGSDGDSDRHKGKGGSDAPSDRLGGYKGTTRPHKARSASAADADGSVTRAKTRSKREAALLRLAPRLEELDDLAWLNLQSPVPPASKSRLKKKARPLRHKVKTGKQAMSAKSAVRNEYSSGDEKYYIY